MIKVIVGWILVIVGVIGLVLPIIPGILFLLIGSSMLGWHFLEKKETGKIKKARSRKKV